MNSLQIYFSYSYFEIAIDILDTIWIKRQLASLADKLSGQT